MEESKCHEMVIHLSLTFSSMLCLFIFPWGRIANICRLRSTELIFVGYSQLNSTTVLDFFAPGMYDTTM